MATLVSEAKALEYRADYPGSFKLWAEAGRLKCKHMLRGGMEISEAKDVVLRADFAVQVARAGVKCSSSMMRLVIGDYTPSARKVKQDSPELISSINAIHAIDERKRTKAMTAIKTALKEWPTCKFGGTLAPVWDKMGLCTWACTVCT